MNITASPDSPGAPVRTETSHAARAPAVVRGAKPALITCRKLGADEHGLHAAHLRRLSEHDRAMRFMGCVPDAHIDDYCQPREAGRRVVLGHFEAGVLRGVAEVVFDAWPPWNGGCELAFSVESQWQGRGIGTALMRRAVALARNRGAAPVRVLFLRENRRMRALALRLGMQLTIRDGEVEATLRPPWPNQLSLLAEALGDGQACWTRWLTGHTAGTRAA
ncbi:MAG: GNAT family N-acetyltransferase [Gammaproteobacteria bacterium]